MVPAEPCSGDQQPLLVCAFQGTLVHRGRRRGHSPQERRRRGVVPVTRWRGDLDGMPVASARTAARRMVHDAAREPRCLFDEVVADAGALAVVGAGHPAASMVDDMVEMPY